MQGIFAPIIVLLLAIGPTTVRAEENDSASALAVIEVPAPQNEAPDLVITGDGLVFMSASIIVPAVPGTSITEGATGGTAEYPGGGPDPSTHIEAFP